MLPVTSLCSLTIISSRWWRENQRIVTTLTAVAFRMHAFITGDFHPANAHPESGFRYKAGSKDLAASEERF